MLGDSVQLTELKTVIHPRNRWSVKRSQYLISIYLTIPIGKLGDRTKSISTSTNEHQEDHQSTRNQSRAGAGKCQSSEEVKVRDW